MEEPVYYPMFGWLTPVLFFFREKYNHNGEAHRPKEILVTVEDVGMLSNTTSHHIQHFPILLN